MAVPKQVAKKLQQTMGEDAGGMMSQWLEDLEETSRGTRAALDGIEAQLAALREEVRVGFARVDVRFAETDARIAREITATQRWMISVWLGSIGFLMAVVMGYMTWLVRGLR